MHRLLLPVKNQADATESIAYAIRRRAEGAHVQVVLLHVSELNETWSLWGNAQPVHAGRRQGTADVFCESLRMLEGLDIGFSTYVRAGPIVFSILDTAEQLECSEIVVSTPGKLHLRFLSKNVVMTLLAWQRSVPVVTVNKHGIRQPSVPHIAAAEASAH
jgi:hypothetical protein